MMSLSSTLYTVQCTVYTYNPGVTIIRGAMTNPQMTISNEKLRRKLTYDNKYPKMITPDDSST